VPGHRVVGAVAPTAGRHRNGAVVVVHTSMGPPTKWTMPVQKAGP
jgi:hypothetical protein